MTGPWEAFQDAPAADPKADGPWSQFHPESGEPMSWGSVAGQAISNLPGSAYNMAAGIAHTVMHPIDTAQGLYDVGKGAVSKAAGAVGVPQDPEAKAQREQALNGVIDFFKDRYGGVENFKHTLATDPAGVAMDLSTILTGGEGVLARLPGATRAANAVGDAARVTNPVNLASKVVSNVGDRVIAPVIGETTGVGAAPIRQAARAGYEGNTTFTDNMRGNVPMSDTVDMAQNAVGQMRRDRGAAYRKNMDAIDEGDKYGYILSYKPIDDAVTKAHDMVYFNGLSKSDAAAETLNKIRSKIDEWGGGWGSEAMQAKGPEWVEAARKYRSVEGVDALKQAIGEIRQTTKPGTLERRVADSVYNATKSSIVEQAPEYAAAMKGYATASDKIDELTKTFSLGEKASTDTALRKLQSTTRNNVNTNYGERTRLLDDLAQYEPDLPNALAGQSLSSPTPRGLAKLGAIGIGGGGVAMHGLPALANPGTLAALPFFSPRLVGEAAYAGGRVGNALMPAAQYIPDAVKAGYIVNALAGRPQNSLRGGIGPRYDENGNLRPGH
ncbi:hypothetical protein [Hyphomicrobium sp. ghe19]|uniref:hypothetical protein n=1 Tax=Hyphomicrobium sp. ghe19 TaxID=2682968 RepID=UPI0013678E71|nr:hypothetical protein HYPP_01530 [Hyphomicrobium sp. ghe19]